MFCLRRGSLIVADLIEMNAPTDGSRDRQASTQVTDAVTCPRAIIPAVLPTRHYDYLQSNPICETAVDRFGSRQTVAIDSAALCLTAKHFFPKSRLRNERALTIAIKVAELILGSASTLE